MLAPCTREYDREEEEEESETRNTIAAHRASRFIAYTSDDRAEKGPKEGARKRKREQEEHRSDKPKPKLTRHFLC
jgi:hypothetical protein